MNKIDIHARPIRHYERIDARDGLIYESGIGGLSRALDESGLTPDFAICYDHHPMNICAVLCRAGDQFQLTYQHADRGIVRETIWSGMDAESAQKIAVARMMQLINRPDAIVSEAKA